jgi:hypothetical protein
MAIEYYIIPSDEVRAAYGQEGAMSIVVDWMSGHFSGTYGHFMPPNVRLDTMDDNETWEKVRLQLMNGALACFRVNEDGSSWQPANVCGPTALRPCITPTCTWKLGPDETVCCFCGTPRDGYKTWR